MRFVRLWAYIVLSVAPVSMALAGTFAEPKGKPILVISGNIENRNTAEGLLLILACWKPLVL